MPRRAPAPSTRPTASTGSSCTATRTSGRSTPGTSSQDYLDTHAADAPGDARRDHGRRPDGRAPPGLPRPRVTIDQRVVLEAGSDVVRFETEVDWHEKHRMLRAEFRPAHYGETVRCEIQFGHIERVDHRARRRREGPVRDLRAQVDRHRGRRRRIRPAQRRQVRAPGQERPAEPQPAALADLPRQDRRPRQPPLHLCVLPVRERRPRQGRSREGYRLNNPLRITDGVAFDSLAAVDDAGVIIETVKRAERRRRRRAAAVREPRAADDDGTPRRPAASRGAPRPTCSSGPSGAADLDRLAFGPFEIKTILLED